MAIYKYFSNEEHLHKFLGGQVYFNSLSYFISCEDRSRRDETEDAILFRQAGGLDINVINRNLHYYDPRYFIPRIRKPDRMFVFCTSTELSEHLYRKFNAKGCLEIYDFEEFKRRLSRGIIKLIHKSKINNRTLLADNIEYYDHVDDLKTKHARPDLIVMSKPTDFSEEKEFRFVFAKDKDAFEVHDGLKVNNITYTLEDRFTPSAHKSTFQILEVKNLSDICKPCNVI